MSDTSGYLGLMLKALRGFIDAVNTTSSKIDVDASTKGRFFEGQVKIPAGSFTGVQLPELPEGCTTMSIQAKSVQNASHKINFNTYRTDDRIVSTGAAGFAPAGMPTVRGTGNVPSRYIELAFFDEDGTVGERTVNWTLQVG